MKSRVLRAPIQPMAGAVGQLSAVLRHRLGRERLEQLRQTKIPILVCTGDQDNLVRPSNSYFLAEALDARLEVFEGCGHVLSMQEPERYNKLILEHIRSAKRAANRSSL
jgi:pimeloyl-ACP methyl ester carboxylesterase